MIVHLLILKTNDLMYPAAIYVAEVLEEVFGRFSSVNVFGISIEVNHVGDSRLYVELVDDAIEDVLAIYVGSPRVCSF